MAINRPARLSTDPALLDILVCPLTGGPLEIAGDELLSRSARLAFPVRSGIPILVASEARPLEDPATPSRDRKSG